MPEVPDIILTTGEVPVIIVDTTDFHSHFRSIFLDSTPEFEVAVSNASVFLGTGALVSVAHTTLSISVPSIQNVVVSSNPLSGFTPSVLPSLFSIVPIFSTYTVEQTSNIVDVEMVPILEEMGKVNNDITQISIQSKETWVDTVLENNTSFLDRNIVNILTNNYQKFANTKSKSAARFMLNRRAF